MKKLKIAQVAPFWFSVPPQSYGGTERVVSYVTEELVRRGHEVTLFASDESKTTARLVSPVPSKSLQAIEFFCDTNYSVINSSVNAIVAARAAEFDIIHSHAGYFSFYFCDLIKTPVVHTLHNQLPRTSEVENDLYRLYKHLNFISISKEFQTHFNLNYIGNAYHGLPLDLFPFSPEKGTYFFWMGRASKNKGELDAIEAARTADVPLTLALSVRPDSKQYYEEKIKPKLNDSIRVLSNVGFEDGPKLYGGAKAFLFPVAWREPFGLIMIEAMACGTPVIAYNRGSVSEIVKDGVTGFVVDPARGIDGLVEAIKRIDEIDRAACRRHVEEHFTVEKMVDQYEALYSEIL